MTTQPRSVCEDGAGLSFLPLYQELYYEKMNLQDAKSRMAKSVESLSTQLRGIQGSKISPNLISSIKVVCEGQVVPIERIAITSVVKNQVVVTLFDPAVLSRDAGIVGRIQKAISAAGFSAYVFSKDTVCVAIQAYGQKEEITAHIKRSAEDARVAIRNIRKKAKKAGVPEGDIQKATDAAIAEVEKIMQSKLQGVSLKSVL
jgi:ribosome recycling factor